MQVEHPRLTERFPDRDFSTLDAERIAEYAAVDLALDALHETKAIVRHNPEGKPMLSGTDSSISISHATDAHGKSHVAVLLTEGPAGIDIETFRPQLARVAPRVFTLEEQHAVHLLKSDWERQALRCLIWTVKEAAWKAFGPALAFEHEIELLEFPDAEEMRAGRICNVRIRKSNHRFFLAILDGNLGVSLGPV